MTGVDGRIALRRAGSSIPTVLKSAVASPRFLVYLCCTLLAVLTSYHLGKEMLPDTVDYHVYAGFSALHNRFNQDYFAAGEQRYFNPYAYVPFYLLLRSGLSQLEIASILALVQSVILWLTYEIGLRVVPADAPKTRLTVAVLAVLLAFANPVLINEFGTSYADVVTAEIALGGWLILLVAVKSPGWGRVLCAALLLGVATALKATNAVHAIAAAVMLPFIPGNWRTRLRYALLFAMGGALGFVLVNAPWSIQLERHFGNPLFPLLNGVFRSPDFSTGTMLDHRFIPASLSAALLRPFSIVLPVTWVDYEMPAPDLRYALLLVLAVLWLVQKMWLNGRSDPSFVTGHKDMMAGRILAALGCAFLVDWVLWLTASANGRYFIPMACVAAVLDVALVFRIFSGQPRLRNYLLVAIFGVQFFQLYAGAEYRDYLPWRRGPWYSISLPVKLASEPNLYFLIGQQTNSIIIPDMPDASGFINLGGTYELSAHGANGRHIETLIRHYAPHLQVVMKEPWIKPRSLRADSPPKLGLANDLLEPFGLIAKAGSCVPIVVSGVDNLFSGPDPGRGTATGPQAVQTARLWTCHVIRFSIGPPPPLPGQQSADLAFDHLEDACPALFQPRRPVDVLLGNPVRGYFFARHYSGTAVHVWIAGGAVRFEKLVDGREQDAGSEEMWANAPPRVTCDWRGAGFLKVITHGSIG